MRTLVIAVIVAALRGALRYLAGSFAHHGYAILFGLVAAESFWFPVPGELSLLAAGYLASRGKLDAFWVAGAGMAAAITGDNLAYLLGRLAGRPLIERFARLLHLHAKRLDTMNDYFDRHAGKTIATARWISPLRGLVALSAGAAHVSWLRFFLFNAIGSVTWASAVTALAYGLSRSLAELAEIFNVTGLVIVGVLVVAAASFLLWRHSRKKRVAGLAARGADTAGAPMADPPGAPAAEPRDDGLPDDDGRESGPAGPICPDVAGESSAPPADKTPAP